MDISTPADAHMSPVYTMGREIRVDGRRLAMGEEGVVEVKEKSKVKDSMTSSQKKKKKQKI